MAILTISYGNRTLQRVVNIFYDNVSHLITNVNVTSTVIPTGLSEGAEFYRQTVGTEYWKLLVSDSYPYATVVYGIAVIPCDLSIDFITTTPKKNNIGGVAYVTGSGTGTLRYRLLGGADQNTSTFSNLQPGTYTVIISRTEDSCQNQAVFTITEISDLIVIATKTDVTVNGGSDGTINLSLQGSGDYSFLWNDAVTTQNRSGLSAGNYQVTITDNQTGQQVITGITIAQPGVVEPDQPMYGTILNAPMLNGLTFVKDQGLDQCINPQTPDNTLFCKQYYPNMTMVNYFNKISKCDQLTVQFNSDYSNHSVELRKYDNNEIYKQEAVFLREENISSTVDYGIYLRNHPDNPGKTRVYFNDGPPPIELSVGENFEVLNNLDGYNDSYQIIAIEQDVVLGYDYLVINLNYLGVSITSPATGRFYDSKTDYNVYEATIDFLDVDNGYYYVKIVGTSENTASLISEPIDVQVEHKNTNKIEYRNTDNAFGLTFTTGYLGMVRIPSKFFKQMTGGERSVSRDADYSLVKINAKKSRIVILEMVKLPPYLLLKLSVIFDCDFWKINNVQYQASEGMDEPDYVDGAMLASSSIKVEQVGWISPYNSEDVNSSVADGGYIITEGGYLRR